MFKLVLSAAAVTIAAPVFSQTPLAFSWEGHRIVGTIDQVGDTRVIKGQDLTTGRDFELHVRNGYVRGSIGSELVAYPAPRAHLTGDSAG